MRRSLLVVGTLIVGGGIAALMFGLGREPLVYSVRIPELASRNLWDQTVRVEGTLVRGTLCRVDAKNGYRFRMADDGAWGPDGKAAPASHEEMSVSYDGSVLPDTFHDRPGVDVRVTVEGERCQTCHDFKASLVMARGWGGKYEFAPHDTPPATPMPRCSALVPKGS